MGSEKGELVTEITCPIVPANPGINRFFSDIRTNPLPGIGLTEPGFIQQQLWEHIAESEEPWPHFLIWESEWQARQGISNLRKAPYLMWGPWMNERKMMLFANIYPREAKDRERSLQQDVNFVASAIRQARGYYQAGMAVSELTRPTLMFYSALMLTQAAAVALFGSDFMVTQIKHGLKTSGEGLGLDGSSTDWPTFISWQRQGDFVALYHTTRWDTYWSSRKENLPWPKFHIMECLRCVGVVNSPRLLAHPWMPIDHLLWSHQEKHCDIYPSSVDHITKTPCFEVPRVVVLFMILFWLGTMSRYHPVAWRRLLAGQSEEGYYFRKALAELPARFVRSMREVLPPPYLIGEAIPPTEIIHAMNPEDVQQQYQLRISTEGKAPERCGEM